MTVRLKASHEIIENRLFGKVRVKQEMVIEVDYDGETLDNIEVHVYENGLYKCEISKLLDKAEGNPLTEMLEAIDWNQLYAEHKTEAKEYFNEEA